jgi:hypothetical protein
LRQAPAYGGGGAAKQKHSLAPGLSASLRALEF